MLNNKNFRRSLLVAVIASGLGISAQQVYAVDGALPATIGGAFNWSDVAVDAPWVAGTIANGNDSFANFETNYSAALTIHVDSDRTIKSIRVGETTAPVFALTIDATNGSTLTLAADTGNALITKNTGTSNDIISTPISLGSNLTINNLRNSATNGFITLSGPISSSSSTNGITVTGAFVFSSSGRSRVFLTGNNSFAGGVTVGETANTNLNSGYLALTNGSATSTPLGTGALTFNTGEIDFSSGNTVTSYANNIVLNNTDPSHGTAGAWFQTGTGIGSTTLSGVMSGPGGYIIVRIGNITVTNDNSSFAGFVDVDNGSLAFTSVTDAGVNSSLGAGSLIKIASEANGTLKYVGTGNSATNRTIRFSEVAAINRTATFDQSGTGSITYNGLNEFTANGNLTVAFNGSGSGLGTMASTLADGTGKVTSVTKAGTGTWALSGANTYTGTTTISGGVLRFAKQVALYNNTPASWTDTNIIVNTGGTAAFSVGGVGEFTSSDIQTLSALGTATGGFLSGSSVGFDTTNAGGTFTYSNVIANTNAGANAVGVAKLGTGTLVLPGTNTYTGNTTVSGGTLNITGNHTTGANYSVASGANLITKNVRVTNALTVDGTATINANGGTAGASKVETLTIGVGGKLNLKDNDLVVATAANVDAVRAAIKTGVAGAAGITSDLPAFGVSTGFGYALGNSSAISPLLAGNLSGQSYDADSVLVKYTFLGDADLDGDSDLNDLGLWAQSFTGDLGNPAIPVTFWTSGDFDYDGDTDLNDLGFWASTFTGDLGGGAGSLIVVAPGAPAGAIAALNSMGITVVPEPSTFVLAGLGLAGLAIAARRRKK